jgi:hypothetical protein
MGMKRCPICGEKYSDVYRTCPFCEEEENLRGGEPPRHHRGGHRVSEREGLLSPILIVLILLMIGVLVYLLFGDTIAKKLNLGESSTPPASSISEPITSSSSSGAGSDAASTSKPTIGDTSEGSGSTPDGGAAPTSVVELDKEDFTLSAGETYAMTASNGSGQYTWISEDEGVASVSDTGVVTAISGGNTTVTVSDGYSEASCIVRVKGAAVVSSSGGTVAAVALDKEDFTLGVGESYTLKVSGTSASVSWAVADSGVATVSGGKVTGIGVGTTKVTATVEGKQLTCIVRVK